MCGFGLMTVSYMYTFKFGYNLFPIVFTFSRELCAQFEQRICAPYLVLVQNAKSGACKCKKRTSYPRYVYSEVHNLFIYIYYEKIFERMTPLSHFLVLSAVLSHDSHTNLKRSV